jgi:hypothetical protein
MWMAWLFFIIFEDALSKVAEKVNLSEKQQMDNSYKRSSQLI